MAEQVAGVVLAAGAGRRFGMPKALVHYDGALLVERAARVLVEGGCQPVLVVLGAAADEVRSSASLDAVTIVMNPRWSTGMGSSLRAALETLTATTAPDEVHAAVIIPVDMPGIGSAAVRRVAAKADAASLVAATYGDRRSHPVLLGRNHWRGAASAATGDAGARYYLNEHAVTHVSCDDISKGFDIDRPADLRPD